MMNNNIGAYGEKKACEYLINNGYKVLVRNFNFNRKEIDIIAQKEQFLIAIEVKTRSQNTLIEPWKAVNKRKQQNIIEAMNAYVKEFQKNLSVRFDVISIVVKEDKCVLNHIKDAFYPTF